MIMLVKDINIKTLVSGDKSARVVLETTAPNQIEDLKELADKIEIDVEFKDNS